MGIASSADFAKKNTKEHLRYLLDQGLPSWDNALLSAQPSPNPLQAMNFYHLTSLLNDSLTTIPAPDTTHFHDGIKAIRLEPHLGLIRYVNRGRAWNSERDADRDPPDLKAMPEFIAQLANSFELNSTELKMAPARWQMAQGSTLKASQPKACFKMYTLAFAQRVINGVPVHQSCLSLAINHRNQIHRLALEWPEFRLQAGSLLSRQHIIEEALNRIEQHQPSERLQIQAHLAYARMKDEKDYRAVVSLAINDLPKPYRLIIPVSKSA